MTTSSIRPGDTPALGVVAGHSVALHFGDIAAEYQALRHRAMLVDRSARGRLRLDGPRAAELMTGLVTGDVLALESGQGLYAAALNPKGKIVADVRILAHDGHLAIDVPPRAWPGWMVMVAKFINPRLAAYTDESTAVRTIGIYGVAARRIVAALSGIAPDDLGALAMYSHRAAEIAGRPVVIARMPEIGLEGYEIFLPAEAFGVVWQRSVAAGAIPTGLIAWEIARIEAGRPEWGLDIDEGTIPQEANFDELHAISYTKGCYVGQEVVARVHFRGHVNRHLRGLVAGQNEAPPSKAAVLDQAGKQVGEVRSSALSPRHGAVALAMIRREVETGAGVRLQWDGVELPAQVVSLPFPS
ncbi:MAG TPA: glycine cleavage T C-terminal barrel domain-containing protein [Gemmatimonadaceae bacterium]|nr:glycine cleavage T C-terminal barrel domain-containing protein [Gemmatimonadaceae bacterium]